MRKIALALVFVLIFLNLSGCSSDMSTSTKQENPIQNTSNEDAVSDSPEESTDFDTSGTIDETVLVDQDNIKITATSLEYDDYSVVTHLTFENNSGKDLTFSSNTLGFSGNFINDVMIPDGYLYVEVPTGKKAMDTIEFDYDQLQFYGINDIAEIGLGFTAEDAEYESVEYHNCTIETSLKDKYVSDGDAFKKAITSDAMRKAFGYDMSFFTNDISYDHNGIQVLSGGLIINKDDEHVVVLEVINNATDTSSVVISGASINGLTVYNDWWSDTTIESNKKAVITINLDDMVEKPFWNAYGITDIGKIEILMGVRDDGDIKNVYFANLNIKDNVSFDDTGDEIYSQDNVTVISKGLFEKTDEDDSYIRFVFLIKNGTNSQLQADIKRNSVSINDIMTDDSTRSSSVESGSTTVLILRLRDSDLEDIEITDVSQIEKIDGVIELEDLNDNIIEVSFAIGF